jgi:hypothetical protein
VKLHQALHGYADGHTLLASSMQMKPRDARTMLVLSDISGSGTRIDDAGYLTGYPLAETGVYALARTWAAPEMPRPGCVWTHTLLIDFSDLATLASLTPLLSQFRRPDRTIQSSYGAVLSFSNEAAPSGLGPDNVRWARSLIGAIYGAPTARIIARAPQNPETERTLFAIWEQQWPRLRRAFRFSTLSGADRSNEAGAFDLQLIPPDDRTGKSRFPDAVEAGLAPALPWVDDALGDLAQPNSKGLRSFFHRVGGDTASGREAFASLCLLNRALSKAGNIDDAIKVLENDLAKTPLKAARSLVVNAAIANLAEQSDNVFRFALRHLDLADRANLDENERQIGAAVATRAPDALAEMLSGDDLSARIALAGLSALTPGDLVQVVRVQPDTLRRALELRPNIICECSFWAAGLSLDEAIATLAVDHDLARGAVEAMIAAGRTDLAIPATSAFGAECIFSALASTPNDAKSEAWISAASRDTAGVAAYLGGSSSATFRILVAIARASAPDSLPARQTDDPWVKAVEHADGSVAETDQVYLRAYLLSRALGWRSSMSAELAQLSFDSVYAAASSNRMADDAWAMLDQRLPWPAFWSSRDQCSRLRSGVVDLFVNRELSALIFADITANDRLFLSLAETAAGTNRGRRFLRRVLKVMKQGVRPTLANRIPVVEALVDW